MWNRVYPKFVPKLNFLILAVVFCFTATQVIFCTIGKMNLFESAFFSSSSETVFLTPFFFFHYALGTFRRYCCLVQFYFLWILRFIRIESYSFPTTFKKRFFWHFKINMISYPSCEFFIRELDAMLSFWQTLRFELLLNLLYA